MNEAGPPGAATPGSDEAPPVLVEGLCKRLGGRPVIQDLDLRVEQGQVFGLAGPNGAGKSVTIKILLGLVRPDRGRAALFGQPVGPGAAVLARVGSLVDGPGFLPYSSGRANLELAAATAGRPISEDDLEWALSVADLGRAVDRKYRTYSHGMRYRLGLAQALLGRPELLLLDEPTTGLDPEHVVTVREVVRQVAGQGGTVVFSSHQLAEVERLCTHAAVMRNGRLVVDGPVPALVEEHGSLEAAYLSSSSGRSSVSA